MCLKLGFRQSSSSLQFFCYFVKNFQVKKIVLDDRTNLENLRLLSTNDSNAEKVFIMVFALKKRKMSITLKLLAIVRSDHRSCESETSREIICCNLLIDAASVSLKWSYEFYTQLLNILLIFIHVHAFRQYKTQVNIIIFQTTQHDGISIYRKKYKSIILRKNMNHTLY